MFDDPKQLFNVATPADFDDYKKERLTEKLKEAKELYEKDKNDNWTWVTLGSVYEYARDYDRAILVYEKAIELNKDAFTAVLCLADIYERQRKDYSQAEKYYKMALEIDPTKPYIYINLAKMYEFRSKQVDKAEGVYLQGLTNLPDDNELTVNLAEFYQRTGYDKKN